MTWLMQPTDDGPHVLPLDDLREHAIARDCWCGPTLDETVWVHHSLDSREQFETGERIAS